MKSESKNSLESLAATGRMSVRAYEGETGTILVYLPGVHGDWTLVGGFRRALGKALTFVEITYPRTETWSLEDYATALEQALREAGVSHGWLLGESFGSQVVWEVLRRGSFQVDGVILAGGFARHPAPWMATAASHLAGKTSGSILRSLLCGYATIGRYRFRKSPESLKGLEEFVGRRTETDIRAMRHRFRLVAQNDPGNWVRKLHVPVYALTGWFDPIVPWYPARRWFRQNCPALYDYKTIFRADHNVLGTAPESAAKQVLQWIKPEANQEPNRAYGKQKNRN